MSFQPSNDQLPATAGAGAPIDLVDLRKRYESGPRAAVEGLTLTFPAGETVAMVGPTGCGKTTLLRMINRMVEPTSGAIRIGGDDVTHTDPNQLRRRIGYAIQQVGLLPHLTVEQNVALVPKLLQWPKEQTRARVKQMLTLVGLDPDEFGRRYPAQMSGGQQQRAGVARALAADPPVLLMDEPFGAVDPITRSRLQDQLVALQRELKKTIVFVTHDFEEAIKIADRVLILREGCHVAQFDTPEVVLSSPSDDFVRAFIGSGAMLKRLSLKRLESIPLNPLAQSGPRISSLATLHDALDTLLAESSDCLTVVDANAAPVGTVDLSLVLAQINHMKTQAGELQR